MSLSYAAVEILNSISTHFRIWDRLFKEYVHEITKFSRLASLGIVTKKRCHCERQRRKFWAAFPFNFLLKDRWGSFEGGFNLTAHCFLEANLTAHCFFGANLTAHYFFQGFRWWTINALVLVFLGLLLAPFCRDLHDISTAAFDEDILFFVTSPAERSEARKTFLLWERRTERDEKILFQYFRRCLWQNIIFVTTPSIHSFMICIEMLFMCSIFLL